MENIFSAIFGVVCIVIGVLNRKGNISMLHAYHRKRVSEEDRLPFGKMVGLGMIIIGLGLIAAAGLFVLSANLQNNIYSIAGNIVLGIGFAVGLIINFYAMIKYNKGIF